MSHSVDSVNFHTPFERGKEEDGALLKCAAQAFWKKKGYPFHFWTHYIFLIGNNRTRSMFSRKKIFRPCFWPCLEPALLSLRGGGSPRSVPYRLFAFLVVSASQFILIPLGDRTHLVFPFLKRSSKKPENGLGPYLRPQVPRLRQVGIPRREREAIWQIRFFNKYIYSSLNSDHPFGPRSLPQAVHQVCKLRREAHFGADLREPSK